jgi:hypothetical protein
MSTHRDAVHALPGWDGPLPSANYSGFIEVVRDGKAAQWHYTLSEAEAPMLPEAAPLVLYVSGGPGGSSFQTSFRGFGQFRLDERSVAGDAFDRTGIPQLIHHEYGWTKAANVLTWESPPGVGFSFCPDPADAVWDDELVAEHSAEFLVGVVDRHPSYRDRTLIVFGASYAGIYIPMLARAILTRGNRYPLRLAAIGVGNAAIGHFPGWNFPDGGQLLTSHDVPCDVSTAIKAVVHTIVIGNFPHYRSLTAALADLVPRGVLFRLGVVFTEPVCQDQGPVWRRSFCAGLSIRWDEGVAAADATRDGPHRWPRQHLFARRNGEQHERYSDGLPSWLKCGVREVVRTKTPNQSERRAGAYRSSCFSCIVDSTTPTR